jgi:hypothetical protein
MASRFRSASPVIAFALLLACAGAGGAAGDGTAAPVAAPAARAAGPDARDSARRSCRRKRVSARHRSAAQRRAAERRRRALIRRCRARRRTPGATQPPPTTSPGTDGPGSGDTAPGTQPPTGGSDPGGGTGGDGGQTSPARLLVSAREFSLTLSRQALPPGTSIVELKNYGEDPHDLHVDSSDGSGPSYAFPETRPGGLEERRLELPAGTYRLYCSIAGHEDLGMRATLRVE